MPLPFEVLLLKFNYEEHTYLIEPMSIDRVSHYSEQEDGPHWVLTGLVVERDNEQRHMQQRGFVLTKIRDVEEVSKVLS